ncbi:cysteine dioxygenase [Streptodolium elevatio]
MPARSLTPAPAPAPNPAALLAFADRAAADPSLVARLPLDPVDRTWLRIGGPGAAEAWLIGWPPGTGTGWHDHGGAVGAFLVVRGTLHEFTPPHPDVRPGSHVDVPFAPGTETQVRLPSGSARSFPRDHIHDVRNTAQADHAVSLHVYSPALTLMRRYEQTGGRLVFHSAEGTADWDHEPEAPDRT